MLKIKLALFVIVAVFSVGICQAASPPTVNVTIQEKSFKLDSNTVKAGKIKFVVTSAATNKMEHEFVVMKTDLADDALPMIADGTRVDEKKLKDMGEVEHVAPGKTKSKVIKLTPGKYVLICNMPDHYKMGFHLPFTVTP